VWLQFDRSAESAARTLSARSGSRWSSSLAFAFSRGFRGTKVTDLASEADLVAGNPAPVGNLNFVVLNSQRLDKGHRVPFDLAFLQLGFAFLGLAFNVGFAGHICAVLFQREGVFLQPSLGVELGFPCAGDIRPGSRE